MLVSPSGQGGRARGQRRSAGTSSSPGPSSQSSFLEKTATAGNWSWYFPHLPYTGCGSCDKRDAEEQSGSPGGTESLRPPGLAKLSLQPRGWPANPAIVRRQNPENRSGPHQRPGSRRGTRCADPGVSLPPEAGRPRSRNAETGWVQRSEDQTLSPAGLTRTPPPARPKVSGRRSPSMRPRRNRRTVGTTMSTMQCTNAAARAARGLCGPRSSLPPRGMSAQPCSQGALGEAD